MSGNFLEELGTEPTVTETTASASEPAKADVSETNGPVAGVSTEGVSETKKVEIVSSQHPEVKDDPVKLREEAAYWRGRYEALNGQAANHTKAEPTLTDEDRRKLEDEYLSDPRGVTEKIISQHMSKALWDFTIKNSEAQMRREARDYDQVAGEFVEMAKRDSSLNYQLSQQADPARFAYNYVMQQKAMKQYGGDPNKIKEEIEKEIRAKVEQEYRQKIAQRDAGLTPVTPAAAKGSGGTTPARPSKMDPLEKNPFD